MQFKVIDTKNKEMYFNSIKIVDDKENNNNNFWNFVNGMAAQNKVYQNLIFA